MISVSTVAARVRICGDPLGGDPGGEAPFTTFRRGEGTAGAVLSLTEARGRGCALGGVEGTEGVPPVFVDAVFAVGNKGSGAAPSPVLLRFAVSFWGAFREGVRRRRGDAETRELPAPIHLYSPFGLWTSLRGD